MDRKLKAKLAGNMPGVVSFLVMEELQGVTYISSTDAAHLSGMCPKCGPADAVTRHRFDPDAPMNACNLVTFCASCRNVIAWNDFAARSVTVLYPITINVDKP